MSNIKTIKYKDSRVYLRECNGNDVQKYNPHKCFCCNHQIENGKALLIVNNYQYVPNMFVHEECFKKYENDTNKLFSNIENSWNEYKELNKIFNGNI